MAADGSLFGRLHGPKVVDLFAGAGGASEGVRRALGYGPIVAINHCRHAIEMHRANHPDTEHYLGDVFEVRPLDATRGRAVDALWASPDCRHFSRAKGGKPVDKKIRGLAWVVVRWAAQVRPRAILMENVSELVTWGPLTRPRRGGRKHLGNKAHLDADGNRVGGVRRARWDKPIPHRKGELFQLFVGHLRALGYVVEWRNLVGCDYGAPTSRKRLYLIARRDGQPIVWPEPTHGPGRPKPWRTAAECIDWSIPMLSIFATPEEAKAWAKEVGADGVPQRPLAEATLARIREGVRRFVLDNPRPFVIRTDMQSDGRLRGIGGLDEPLRTVTTGGGHAVVAPMLQTLTHGQRHEALDEPMRTVTGAHRGERVVVSPVMVANNTNNAPHGPAEPLGAVTGGGRHIVAAAHLIETRNGEREGQAPRVRDIERPLGTTTAKGSQGAVVAAFLAQHNGGENGHQAYGRGLEEPMQTIAGSINKAPVAVHLSQFNGRSVGSGLDEPADTVLGRSKAAMVSAFLSPYYGSERDGQELTEPLRTVTTKDRLGLVTVTIDGTEFAIVDIAMRMLQPHELAAANGWPDMVRTGTKAEQVARIGNMVLPDVAAALFTANLHDLAPGATHAR